MDIALHHTSGILQSSNTIMALARQISRSSRSDRAALFQRMREVRDELIDEIDLAAAAFDADSVDEECPECDLADAPALELAG